MGLLDDRIPLYTFQWMDSGRSYHYACGGRLLVLVTFAVAVAIAARVRAPGWAIWFGVLGLGAFCGFPLELAGSLLLVSYFFWTFTLAIQHKARARLPALGLVVLAGSVLSGFPRTFVAGGGHCASNMKNLAMAAEMYMSDFREAPRSWEQLQENGYLRRLPECGPGRATYRLESKGQSFTVYCESELHPPPDPARPHLFVSPTPRIK